MLRLKPLQTEHHSLTKRDKLEKNVIHYSLHPLFHYSLFIIHYSLFILVTVRQSDEAILAVIASEARQSIRACYDVRNFHSSLTQRT